MILILAIVNLEQFVLIGSPVWSLICCYCFLCCSKFDVISGMEIKLSNNQSCPIDHNTKCISPSGQKVWMFIKRHHLKRHFIWSYANHQIHGHNPNIRDCQGGQLSVCTESQPCTPCSRSSLHVNTVSYFFTLRLFFFSFLPFVVSNWKCAIWYSFCLLDMECRSMQNLFIR